MNITDVGHLSSDAGTGADKMLKGASGVHKARHGDRPVRPGCFLLQLPPAQHQAPGRGWKPAPTASGALYQPGQSWRDTGCTPTLAAAALYFDTSELAIISSTAAEEEDLASGRVREAWKGTPAKRNKNDFILWFHPGDPSLRTRGPLKSDSPGMLSYPAGTLSAPSISPSNTTVSIWTCTAAAWTMQHPHHTNGDQLSPRATWSHPWCPQWFLCPPPEQHRHWQDEQVQGRVFDRFPCWRKKATILWSPRLSTSSPHYRKALVFTWENLDNAKTAYDKLPSAWIAALKEGGDVS